MFIFSYSHNITFLFPARDEFDEYGDLTTPKKLCAPGLEGLPEISEILTGEKKFLSDEVLFLVGVRLKWDIYRDFGSRARIGRTLENTGSSVCYVDTEKTDKAIRTFHQKLINEIGGFKKLTISGVGRLIRGFLYHVRIRGGIAHEDTERYIMADGFGKLLGRNESISRLIPRKRSWGNLPAYPCSKGVPYFDSLAGTRPERTWYGRWAIRCFKPVNPHILDYIKELYGICTAALVEKNILIEFTTNKGKKVWGIDQSVLRLTFATSLLKCDNQVCNYRLTVAEKEKGKWFELPCPRAGCNGYLIPEEEKINYYRKLYETGDVNRIIPREHTGLLSRKEREELEDQLGENTKAFLLNYMVARDHGRVQPAEKLYQCFRDISRERNSINTRQKDLRKDIARYENNTVLDEKSEGEVKEMKREANALSRIVKQIFEFLTDEGLLPNYTFPESGVILRSLILKERTSDNEDNFPTPYEYQRPAQTALTEFAPHNVFYAGGRKVEIDQVDLSTATIEKWRFCSDCDYCINEELSPTAAACPRCGSPLWRDNERVKYMVRMRQVYATTQDRKSRIYDEKEEREPSFFTTIGPQHMLRPHLISITIGTSTLLRTQLC